MIRRLRRGRAILVEVIALLICLFGLMAMQPENALGQSPDNALTVRQEVNPSQALVGETIEVVIELHSDETVCGSGPTVSVPLDVALLIDNSGTMTGKRLTDAKSAAIAFIEELAGRRQGGTAIDQVAILEFNQEAVLRHALSRQHEAVKRQVEAIPESNIITNLDRGLVAGFEALRDPAVANSRADSVLIILSDGDSDADAAERAAETAKVAGVRVISICLGEGDDVDCDLMRRIATADQDAYRSLTSADLKALYRSIARELIRPQAVTNLQYEHRYDASQIRVHGAVSDGGVVVSPGTIIWKFADLRVTEVISYAAEVLVTGRVSIDAGSVATFVLCEQEEPVKRSVLPSLMVDVTTPTPTSTATPAATSTPTMTPTTTPTVTPTFTPTPKRWLGPIFVAPGSFNWLSWWWLLPLLLLLILLLVFLLRALRSGPGVSVSTPSRRTGSAPRHTPEGQPRIKKPRGHSIMHDRSSKRPESPKKRSR